ncbi:MAG: TonB family protein [Pyrinomonadaceae bacterium]
MNSASLSRIKSKRLYILSVFSLVSLLLSLSIVWQTGQAQQSLSLADILIGLRSKKVTLEDRNKLLASAVKVRGITFALTPEIEKELENTGADKELVEAIRQKSAPVKVTLTPTPIPFSTPAPSPTPPDFAFYQKQADAHMVKGEYDLAVADYDKAIELNPKNASSYLSRGLSYYNKNSYDLAISDYNKGIELSPKESIAYFNRGDSYEKLGNAQKALADYQKAVELDAANETAKNALKRLQDEQAKTEQAKAEQPKTFTQPRPQETASTPEKTPATIVESPKTQPQIVSLGQLNIERAVKMVTPLYPPDAQKFKIEGQVTVQINLDEGGNVTSAKAVSGPGLLRASAEDAARKSKFKPALVGDKAIKATGFIVYNFKAN